jgi:hypothetical protein
MKKLLLSIILFYSLFTEAQTSIYHPFPDSNAVWSVDTQKVIIRGDSIISSKTYSKYYQTSDTNLVSSFQLKGLVRQDIPARKVFGIAPGDTKEHILYDFNLNTGDTITVYSIGFYGVDLIKIQSTDSILIAGQYRKRMHLACYSSSVNFPEFWIEGIGSSFGPLSPGLTCMPVVCVCYPNMICESEQGVQNYIDPIYNSCHYQTCITNVNGLKVDNHLKIYPNPASNSLSISTANRLGEISIYNSIGEIVRLTNKPTHFDKLSAGTNPSKEGNVITIDISKLQGGIYFLKAWESTPSGQSNGKVYTSKFVKD